MARSTNPMQPLLSHWLLAWVVCMTLAVVSFHTPAEARNRKSRKSTARATQKSPTKVATEPNFDLDDWLYEARLACRSTSVGQANRGEVLRTEKMDLKGRSWRFLPAVKERGTQHGTFGLVRLLEHAADTVAEEFPGSVLEIGNIGRSSGGPITQSKSHQAGRDVDLAFFATDARGSRRPTGRMLKFDQQLKAGTYQFDTPRNWALVKALISSDEPVVQWLFVSAPIRTALLDYAREQKEPGKLLRLAASVLHQPGDSAAHADHFHVRIFCSDWDRANGCRDYGPERTSLSRDGHLLETRASRLIRKAKRGLTRERQAALKHLSQLPDVDLPGLVESLLSDADPAMVEMAMDLLGRTHPGKRDEVLTRKLAAAGSLDGLYTLFRPVATYQDKKVWKVARQVLADQSCQAPDAQGTPFATQLDRLCTHAAQALGYSRTLSDGRLLYPLLAAKDSTIRRTALRSLRTLFVTRDPILPGETSAPKGSPLEQWQALVEAQSKEKWAVQAASQLNRQGYAIGKKLVSRSNTAELLRAVKAGHPLSFTGQIVLAKLYQIDWLRPLKAAAAYKRFSQMDAVTDTADANRSKGSSPGKLPELPTLD